MLQNARVTLLKNGPLFVAFCVGIVGCVFFRALIAPAIQDLYRDKPTVFYAPAHFGDARQYVFICNQGYSVPIGTPTIRASRLSWMPIYPLLQCVLHKLTNVSLVYTGVLISTLAMGVAVIFSALTLRILQIPNSALCGLAILIPPLGAAWLYLPGAEAIFLCFGSIALWLLARPVSPNKGRELVRVMMGAALGVILILTKPNALALLLPFLFAFVYLSWKKSQQAGYAFGLATFCADIVIDHFRPILILFRLVGSSHPAQPIRYNWMPLTLMVGILLGFAFWLAYSSFLSGIPFYFLDQQLDFWGRAWSVGNLNEMLLYFAQALHTPDRNKPWNYGAAWSLAALLSALIPAVSARVPILIRGMLALLIGFMLFTGTAQYASDRYLASTMLVGIGWACWLSGRTWKSALIGWLFLIGTTAITTYLLVGQMLPFGEPRFWGILPDSGLLPW